MRWRGVRGATVGQERWTFWQVPNPVLSCLALLRSFSTSRGSLHLLLCSHRSFIFKLSHLLLEHP